jgi:carbamoyl-phosphate synthase small subunit
MYSSFLILEDGQIFPGKSFGLPPLKAADLEHNTTEADLVKARGAKLPAGEVVFNTGMAGYHEIITDPSYSGQIIVMTYPHIGNYGTDQEWNEMGPGEGEPAQYLKAAGMVIRSLYDGPLPHGRKSLHEFMLDYKTTGITDIDTRRLTLHLRESGSLTGLIVQASDKLAPETSVSAKHYTENHFLSQTDLTRCLGFLAGFPKMEGRNLVYELNRNNILTINQGGAPHISLIDCGAKANIIREMVNLGCQVSLVPNAISSGDLLALKQDAILISNGPGDPAVLNNIIQLTKDCLGKKPVFGICLGHQLISLALGARTYKLKFGHHGVNNPVRDEETGIVQVTSQNHGFAVEEKSLPAGCQVRFRNVNDQTIEGIIDRKLPTLTAQFHPEAAPGPRDSLWIFKSFLELI